MFLWHGTYEEYKDDIIKDGLIKRSKIDSTTMEYDELFIKYLGFTPRENCVYFSGDTESANGYDFAFKVNINDLDLDRLYVGDFRLLDDVMCTSDEKEQEILIKKYKDTLVSFDEYMNNAHGYLERSIWELEFLYFNDVYVSEEDLD